MKGHQQYGPAVVIKTFPLIFMQGPMTREKQENRHAGYNKRTDTEQVLQTGAPIKPKIATTTIFALFLMIQTQ